MTAIEINSLGRVFKQKGGEPRRALEDVTLSIDRGEVHALLGPNGAGKTTLCRILSTGLLPTSGEARVLGHDVVSETNAVRRYVGVVFGGDRGLYGKLSARQNLSFWAALFGGSSRERRHRVEGLLDRLGLTERADEPVQGFSRGMKQRVHLARGLVGDPAVLILDEPTAGMDPVAAHDFRALVRELQAGGCTILLTTHDMVEAAALSNRVSFIDGGILSLTESPDMVGEVVSSYERLDVQGLPVALAERIAEISGVVSVRTDSRGQSTRIETQTAEAMRAVLREVVDGGIIDISRTRPSLEEVYLHLVGRRGMNLR